MRRLLIEIQMGGVEEDVRSIVIRAIQVESSPEFGEDSVGENLFLPFFFSKYLISS